MAHLHANVSISEHLTFAEHFFMWLFKEKLNADNSMSDEDRNPHEKYIIGVITMTFAMINFLITITVTINLLRIKSMQNSFGYLNISHGIGDSLVLLIFILWYAPMIIIGSEIDQTLVALKIAHFTAICMCGANHSAIFIAAGRYNALVHPFKYSLVFTRRRTMIFIAIAWATAFGHHCLSFFHTLCGEFLSWFVDLCYGLVMIILIGGTDIATFYQMRKAKQVRTLSDKHS
ncbi:D(2) dopamine receptor A [Toxocara canis]|uniref:D(2) dopamine receptor A n=1 Tax=Toxocara canis TaxID=6265 RepID=A0A0B2W2H7_TOXCA|nr:D(2) dopamine receptor A [Toxocara canis]